MAPIIKLCVGIAGTSLLATAAYGLMRAPLLSTLGGRAADVMLANGITDGRANWVTPAGWTMRIARLSGTADAPTRQRTRAAVASLTGVSDAVWEDETDTGVAAPASSIDAGIGIDACTTRIGAIVADSPIAFGASNATIAASSVRAVDAVAQALQSCPAAHVEIIGHTGLAGSHAVNLALSQARAEALQQALAQRGVADGRMQAIGKGSAEARDDAAPGQRIEFKLGPPPQEAAR